MNTLKRELWNLIIGLSAILGFAGIVAVVAGIVYVAITWPWIGIPLVILISAWVFGNIMSNSQC